MTTRRKIILSAIILVLLIGVALFLLIPKSNSNNDKPTVSVEKQGETITPTTQNSDQTDGNPTGTDAQQPSTATPEPTTSEFSTQIQKATPYYTDSSTGQANFGITAVKQPIAGWFIVKVTPNDSKQQPVKYIFKQTNDPNNPLTIVAGPGTAFPPEYVSLPDEVRKAI